MDYSKSFQSKAADDLAVQPKDSPVATMVGDYGKLRKACRAMEKP